jgi:uncharacterized protein YndB with AHSA1/START domain
MVRIACEIVINRPIETVFDFIAAERNEPRYNPNMVNAEMISNVPIGTGTRFRAVVKSFGRNPEMIIEITEYDRPHRLPSSIHSSTMDINGTLTFSIAGNRTHMQ